jgi:2-dehydropantoate 2-reductase
VAVVGAGAVGGYFGGMLARAGARVVLIGRPEHVSVWQRDGLFIDGMHFQERIAIEASTEIAAAGAAELVLFSVKGMDTETAGIALAQSARKDAVIVSLQNGVENVSRLRATARLDPIGAAVYVACSMPSPGRVKHSGRGDLVIGDLPGRDASPRDQVLSRVAGWFDRAQVPCRVSANIEGDLWTKLITNVALNAMSAVAHVTYGEIVSIPESRETIRWLVNECIAVANASGVKLPDTDFVEMAWDFGEKAQTVYASTSQDLERGRRTEIDALNGLVVRRGAELGIPTPVNQALVTLVKLRERKLVKPAG